MTCVEIRCRDCDELISTCSCPGEKTLYLQQCRTCETQELAEAEVSRKTREALQPGGRR
jgi:hypothetical protein